MTSGHRLRLKDLFAKALEVPSNERAQFVERACLGDAALRAELESLLASASAAEDFLEQPARFHAAALTPFVPANVEPLEAFRRLGPYEILEPLGAGGMGQVYRARDVRLGRLVALKVLPPAIARSAEARRRFDQEARVIAKLNHPHICALYDVGHHDGIDFIVMEYVEGETLAERVARGPLPPAMLVPCALALADALGCAHRLGIIHRDVKPSNVVLAESPIDASGSVQAKLLDFGIAKLRDQELEPGGQQTLPVSDLAITQQGRVIGTVGYMSPEQVRGEPIDERSDVFSLGAVLFEMTTGRRPFTGPNADAVCEAILAGAPPLDDLPAATPPGIAAIIRKALEPDRERRYQHASEVAADLKGLDPARGRIRWTRAAVAAVLLLTAAAGTSFLFTSANAKQPVHRRSENAAAYEAYLKGRYFWNMRTTDGLQKALGYFQDAIAMDPRYAPSYAGVADTYAMLGSMPYAVMPASEASAKAKAAARQALALDESVPEAHVSLAFVTYAFDRDWVSGEREFKRAIELDPSYGTAHLWYALYLGQLGRVDEALAESERCRALDPLSLIGTYSVGLSYYFGRHYDQAEAFARKALEIDPNFPGARRLLGQIFAAEGRAADMVTEMERLNATGSPNWLHRGLLAQAYGRAGERAKATEILDAMVAASKTQFVPAAQIAMGYLGLADRDAAFAWLGRAVDERSQALNFLKMDPMFDPIRADARFPELLRQAGFTR